MTNILDRIKGTPQGAAIARTDGLIETILGRVEAGESPAKIARDSGLTAVDIVAAAAHAGLGSSPESAPPLVQRRPPRPKLARAMDEPALAQLFPSAGRAARFALAAGLLLILDEWHGAHEAAQKADDLGETRTSAYWHGIAHRREPDPGNAAYWFRRVGKHPVFDALSADWERLAGAADLTKPAVQGRWDPYAFIEFCGKGGGEPSGEGPARALQRLEMGYLLEYTLDACNQ